MSKEENHNPRPVKDMAEHELQVGDTVCFTLSMRKDQKPLVRARIKDFVYAKKPDYQGQYQDRIVPEYIECPMVKWGRNEDKLPERVRPNRVVKCY